MQKLVEKLIEKKAELGVTNAWIAEESGVPESTVTKVMNGTNKSPQMATLVPIAEALDVPLSSKTIERITAQSEPAPTTEMVNQTIAAMERSHERLTAEMEKRIADKDRQIRHMWWVIIILAILFLSCVIGFVILYIYDHSVPDRGWITQSTEYARRFTGQVTDFIKEIFTV